MSANSASRKISSAAILSGFARARPEKYQNNGALESNSSCPGLSRASTSWRFRSKKNVGGRDKPGHDERTNVAWRELALARRFQPLEQKRQQRVDPRGLG